MLFISVCHFDHGKTDYFVTEFEAFLEDFNNLVLAFFLIVHVHHRVVELRIKGLAEALDLRDADGLPGAEI